MGWFSSSDSDDNNGVNTFPTDTSGDFGRDYDDGPATEQGNDGDDSGDSGNR